MHFCFCIACLLGCQLSSNVSAILASLNFLALYYLMCQRPFYVFCFPLLLLSELDLCINYSLFMLYSCQFFLPQVVVSAVLDSDVGCILNPTQYFCGTCCYSVCMLVGQFCILLQIVSWAFCESSAMLDGIYILAPISRICSHSKDPFHF